MDAKPSARRWYRDPVVLTYNTPGLYRAVAAMMLVERWRKRDWLVYIGYNSISPKDRTMGQPAELTDSDRTFAHLAAMEVFRGTLEDTTPPFNALRVAAEGFAIPPETMILWFAQLVLEWRKAQYEYASAHTHAMQPQPTGYIEHDEAMARAREARALYGKPSKATRVRVDRGDFVRVSGLVLCEVCQVEYVDHDPVIGFPWLRHACDGRLIKP